MSSRIRTPFYIFFLNPDYVAARSLCSLRSNKYPIYIPANINLAVKLLQPSWTTKEFSTNLTSEYFMLKFDFEI